MKRGLLERELKMGIDGFYMGEELWKFERDVLRNEGLKILYKKILLTE